VVAGGRSCGPDMVPSALRVRLVGGGTVIPLGAWICEAAVTNGLGLTFCGTAVEPEA
jgi:hypothetical protein